MCSALAVTLNLPVWSHDNGFEDADVESHTTAEFLKTLGIESTGSGRVLGMSIEHCDVKERG
jgi:hypothetical protein